MPRAKKVTAPAAAAPAAAPAISQEQLAAALAALLGGMVAPAPAAAAPAAIDDSGEGETVESLPSSRDIHSRTVDSNDYPFHAIGKTDKHGQPIPLAVRPADRLAFMQSASKVQWGVNVSATVHDKQGKPQSTTFPAIAQMGAKRFSSGNHGLYGQVTGIRIVLQDGSEYELTGNVSLLLKKRHA